MQINPVTVYHVPALADDVARLATGRLRVVDCTVGGGGHAQRLLATAERLLAIDRDPHAVQYAREMIPDSRVEWLTGSFAAQATLAAIAAFRPDFVLFDLGVSFHQIDDDARGFSFRPGVPLDMRMNRCETVTAGALLNTLPVADLARLFAANADEPRARALARAIGRRRARAPFRTSDDLVAAIREVLGPRSGPQDFARLFQAARMAVNHELDDLATALPAVLESLVPGGILAVISYHSGEDRMVKQVFQAWARQCICPPRQPVCSCRGRPLGRMDPKKPIRPSSEEVVANPRCRSAKLRVFYRAETS